MRLFSEMRDETFPMGIGSCPHEQEQMPDPHTRCPVQLPRPTERLREGVGLCKAGERVVGLRMDLLSPGQEGAEDPTPILTCKFGQEVEGMPGPFDLRAVSRMENLGSSVWLAPYLVTQAWCSWWGEIRSRTLVRE